MKLNLNPLYWVGKKYLEEQIRQETKDLRDKVIELEKDVIFLRHSVVDHKERIVKLEDRVRDFEIKITAVETAFSVVGLLNGRSSDNSFLFNYERRSNNG